MHKVVDGALQNNKNKCFLWTFVLLVVWVVFVQWYWYLALLVLHLYLYLYLYLYFRLHMNQHQKPGRYAHAADLPSEKEAS